MKTKTDIDILQDKKDRRFARILCAAYCVFAVISSFSFLYFMGENNIKALIFCIVTMGCMILSALYSTFAAR